MRDTGTATYLRPESIIAAVRSVKPSPVDDEWFDKKSRELGFEDFADLYRKHGAKE